MERKKQRKPPWNLKKKLQNLTRQEQTSYLGTLAQNEQHEDIPGQSPRTFKAKKKNPFSPLEHKSMWLHKGKKSRLFWDFSNSNPSCQKEKERRI